MPFYTAESSLEVSVILNTPSLLYFVESSGFLLHSQDYVYSSDSGKSSLRFLIGGTGWDRRVININL